eukprot:CAMPEP_0206228906 /NCGR_PEP_ID=MMETSP0047_2-20121206/9414_1 /ASSEMBLY_ACC=CAM_ASM_000192 /TAXON_ID=195065 /ORGANISM="Chroomonas mesostigmatica_cf, Strain CCMP1168" /LENGTH=394 /DNA_ID=CAMNT_0053652171 /DNA_START=2417 /DNA_END=3599 /DNA_ORIENTATION=+
MKKKFFGDRPEIYERGHQAGDGDGRGRGTQGAAGCEREETGGEEGGDAKRAKADEPAEKPAKAPAETPAAAPAADAQQPAAAAGDSAPADAGAAVAPNPFNLPEQLKPGVRARLEMLFSSGKIGRDELDLKILSSLAEFPEVKGSEIVDHFADADTGSIRNKSAFLAGVIRRYRTEMQSMGGGGFGGGGGGYGGGGGGGLSGMAASYGGGYGGPPAAGQGATLSPMVSAKLESIFSSGQIRRDDLDTRCLDQLRALPEHSAMEVLQKYSEADLSSINSKAGFFMGIVKRFREQTAAADPMVTNSAYSQLSYTIQTKLESLFSTGLISRTELDAKCYTELRYLSEQTANDIVDKFCEANLSEIRNKTAFFLGIVKRMKNERGGGGGGGFGGGGGG